MFFWIGIPASPWHGAQALAFASMGSWANALWLASISAAKRAARLQIEGRGTRTMAAPFVTGSYRSSHKEDGASLPRPTQVLLLLAFIGRWDRQSTVKAMMLFPRLKSIWVLPPAPTTMYCLPSSV